MQSCPEKFFFENGKLLIAHRKCISQMENSFLKMGNAKWKMENLFGTFIANGKFIMENGKWKKMQKHAKKKSFLVPPCPPLL